MTQNKTELRQKLKRTRLKLSEDELIDASEAISNRLINEIDWQPFKSLHFFEPITKLNEIDVSHLIDFLRTNQVRLYTSKKVGKVWRVIDLSTNQPRTTVPDFDVIIVPMLGFDESLHRIGYGGGYYDQLLASQPQARRIGVCLEQGRVKNLPVEPHDVALDMIITEKQVYT